MKVEARLKWLSIFAALVWTCSARATVRTWTGIAGQDWFNVANWSPSDSCPSNGDSVMICAGTALLSNASACLDSFTITNATVVFSNASAMLVSREIFVLAGGVLTHTANSDTNGADGWQVDGQISVEATNMLVTAGGALRADGRGYRGGWYSVTGYNPPGYGPGASAGGTYGAGGAGHGGAGGRSSSESGNLAGGAAYGSASDPDLPGSGAGGFQIYDGRRGGGLIRIVVNDRLVIDGSVSANGEDGGSWYAGGSGGGISIRCRTIEGSGSIQANGGTASVGGSRGGGSGAGGRISIVYDTAAQAMVSPPPALVLEANGGTGTGLVPPYRGQPGTLWLSDTNFFPLSPVRGGQILIPGFTRWTVPALTLTAGQTFFPEGFDLTVTGNLNVSDTAGFLVTNSRLRVGGDLVISGSLISASFIHSGSNASFTVGRNLLIDGASLEYRLASQGDTNRLIVPGALILTNQARFAFYSGTDAISRAEVWCGGDFHINNGAMVLWSAMTNPPEGPDYGALVDVGGTLLIGTNNAWIYPHSHPENGGSALFRMRNLLIGASTNCGINANECGYRGGVDAGGAGYQPGMGPGRSLAGVYAGRGAGYGGGGGLSGDSGSVFTGGVAYGSSNAPGDPGSGGGEVQHTSGAYGGGLIRIEADKVVLDGVLSADSRTYHGSWWGPGSGGGVYIKCRRFQGGPTGLISARGGWGAGEASDRGHGGGGGGGRVAIWRVVDGGWAGAITVEGGPPQAGPTVSNATAGADGTIVWGWLRPGGTVFAVR